MVGLAIQAMLWEDLATLLAKGAGITIFIGICMFITTKPGSGNRVGKTRQIRDYTLLGLCLVPGSIVGLASCWCYYNSFSAWNKI